MSETTIEQSSANTSSCCGPAKSSANDHILKRIYVTLKNNMAVSVTGVLFIVLLFSDTTQVPETIKFVLVNLVQIAPFLGLAIGLAAYAKASGADGLIAHVFSGRLGFMIVAAALFGGLSPFCSCGVIPLIAALLAMGVPLPAVMAFWLASPIMDP
jgi:hypothetical protein